MLLVLLSASWARDHGVLLQKSQISTTYYSQRVVNAQTVRDLWGVLNRLATQVGL